MDWLELAAFNALSNDEKKVRRMEGKLPVNMAAEMPGPYRLWRLCRDNDTLYWPGGLADQPFILLMEFQACERASRNT